MSSVVLQQKARIWIALVFAAGFLCCMSIGLTRFWRDIFLPGDLSAFLASLFDIYSASLGLICGSLIATRKRRGTSVSAQTVWISVICSVAWNILVLVIAARLMFDDDLKFSAIRETWLAVGQRAGFLTAAVLAYFFSSQEQKKA